MLVNGNHINSVCGVLGRYFRKLSEALFGEAYFDQLMNVISKELLVDLISLVIKLILREPPSTSCKHSQGKI